MLHAIITQTLTTINGAFRLRTLSARSEQRSLILLNPLTSAARGFHVLRYDHLSDFHAAVKSSIATYLTFYFCSRRRLVFFSRSFGRFQSLDCFPSLIRQYPSTNRSSSLVWCWFYTHGLLSRVWIDERIEFNAVFLLMSILNDHEHNAVTSVHNQRINCFWRNLWNNINCNEKEYKRFKFEKQI